MRLGGPVASDPAPGDASHRDGRSPSAEAVRQELERVLASPDFVASDRLKKFLRFVVEETLAGRADRLHAYPIALEVLGRDASFDPQTDPVVRMEAGRLRRRLERYYLRAGQTDPVRIDIPKGGYAPTFEKRRDPVPDPSASLPADDARRRWHWLTTTVLALPILGVLGWLGTSLLAPRLWSEGSQHAATALPRGPKIAVSPFLNLSGDPGQAYLAEGITEQIVTDLARFKALFVLSTESTAKYQEQSADPEHLNREIGIDYLLDGNVRRESDTIMLSTRLIDAESGKIIWSETYKDQLIPSNVFKIQEDVSEQVSAIIANNYGLIAEADLEKARHRSPKSFDAYDCVLRYYHYQKTVDQQEHAKVRTCLEGAVELDPDYADAWAVLANIYAQEHRFGAIMHLTQHRLDV